MADAISYRRAANERSVTTRVHFIGE